MATTIYHVARNGWDGGDLLSLAARLHGAWSEDVAEAIAASWPDCDPWAYYCTEGHLIHCHETLEQAREFAAECGGAVLAVNTDGLLVEVGDEYPHPVVRERIESTNITPVE